MCRTRFHRLSRPPRRRLPDTSAPDRMIPPPPSFPKTGGAKIKVRGIGSISQENWTYASDMPMLPKLHNDPNRIDLQRSSWKQLPNGRTSRARRPGSRAPLARRRGRDTLGYVGERAGGGSGQKEGARASIRLGLRKKIKVREMSPFSQERRVYASEAWTDRRSGNFRRN